jgi:hypothetical protein
MMFTLFIHGLMALVAVDGSEPVSEAIPSTVTMFPTEGQVMFSPVSTSTTTSPEPSFMVNETG